MAGLTVLVTGVTRYIGSALAGRLAGHPAVDRVIGVDAALPEPAARARLGDAEFARADIRSPIISKVIEAAGVDTVVHASASSTPNGSAARSMAKEMNVLGTMQLLAACQRNAGVRNLIVRSTSAVYGSSPRDPAVAVEDAPARSVASSGMARDAVDIEGYVRGFGRRRPDVRIAVPRFSAIIGPTVRTPLTRYFSLSPFVPVVAGHDARMQLVHERDAVALLEHLVLGEFAGIVNVAGDGAMTVTQAIRRAGRLPLQIPSPALESVGRVLRMLQFSGFSAAQVRSMTAGRVLDTTRLRVEVGFTPEFSTVAAFDDFVGRLKPVVDAAAVRGAEVGIASAIGVPPQADGPWHSRATVAAGPPTTSAVHNESTATGAVADVAPPAARRRLFSIDGEAARSSTRTPRPGGGRK